MPPNPFALLLEIPNSCFTASTVNSWITPVIGCLLVEEQKAEYFVSVEEVITTTSTNDMFQVCNKHTSTIHKICSMQTIKTSSHVF